MGNFLPPEDISNEVIINTDDGSGVVPDFRILVLLVFLLEEGDEVGVLGYHGVLALALGARLAMFRELIHWLYN